SKLARNALWFVRAVDLAYTVPTNTLTFDVPATAVYVGPPGTTRETDPGVASVGSLAPVTAGTPVSDERHLVLKDGSPARSVVENSIRARDKFVFVMVLAPRIDAGAPLPAGALAVRMIPRILLGFPL